MSMPKSIDIVNIFVSVTGGSVFDTQCVHESDRRMLTAKINLVYYWSFLTSYVNSTTYTMGDVPLALRSCGMLRHVAACCGDAQLRAAPHTV